MTDVAPKEIVRAAKLRDDLSFASFRHGGFTEAADADLTDAQLPAAGRQRHRHDRSVDLQRLRTHIVALHLADMSQTPILGRALRTRGAGWWLEIPDIARR